jgi:hypothetical protein
MCSHETCLLKYETEQKWRQNWSTPLRFAIEFNGHFADFNVKPHCTKTHEQSNQVENEVFRPDYLN